KLLKLLQNQYNCDIIGGVNLHQFYNPEVIKSEFISSANIRA
ncbi:MAG: hypothetical protein UW91_C0048G0001, partial [Parcubacteria group bacterium GW2011_GWF2_45_11]